MTTLVSAQQWSEYEQHGYLRLGSVLDPAETAALQRRMQEIMLGQVDYSTLSFQLDGGGAYEELPAPAPQRSGRTLGYRRVQGLEADPLVMDVLRRPVFREICGRHYGRHASLSIFRAMLVNKPASLSTPQPWHQDGGDAWNLDRDPLVTVWIALDAASRMNGCVQVIPGSHRLGLLARTAASTLRPEDAQRHCPEHAIAHLEVEAGEALLLHNWLVNRSDVNRTGSAQRALSVCYVDARTRNTHTGDAFPVVLGEELDAEKAWPFLQFLERENRRLRETAAEAERYARSLAEHAERLQKMCSEAERRARSIELELARVRGERPPSVGRARLPGTRDP